MLTHRLRRWPNIGQTSGRCIVFARILLLFAFALYSCEHCLVGEVGIARGEDEDVSSRSSKCTFK